MSMVRRMEDFMLIVVCGNGRIPDELLKSVSELTIIYAMCGLLYVSTVWQLRTVVPRANPAKGKVQRVKYKV